MGEEDCSRSHSQRVVLMVVVRVLVLFIGTRSRGERLLSV